MMFAVSIRQVATARSVLAVGLSYARWRSTNRTSSIWGGHAATPALFQAELL